MLGSLTQKFKLSVDIWKDASINIWFNKKSKYIKNNHVNTKDCKFEVYIFDKRTPKDKLKK